MDCVGLLFGDPINLEQIDHRIRLELLNLLHILPVTFLQGVQWVPRLIQAQHNKNFPVTPAGQQAGQISFPKVCIGSSLGKELKHTEPHPGKVVRLAQAGIHGQTHHAGISNEKRIVKPGLVLPIYRRRSGRLRCLLRRLCRLRLYGWRRRFRGLTWAGRLRDGRL